MFGFSYQLRAIIRFAALFVCAFAASCGGAPCKCAETTPQPPCANASATSVGAASPQAPSASLVAPEGMVAVPGGPFLRGSPANVGLDDEHPQRKIVLSTFAIDRTEVTQGDYARCAAAGVCTANVCDGEYARDDHHPVVCVAWDQARAYCAWVGKRLPTEAEWEKAARGTDGRSYPWGNNPPTCELARYYGCGNGEADAVGRHPKGASPYGALDMAGNVWEWVSDWHDDTYYTTSPAKDPRGPSQGTLKVVRGGAFKYGPDQLSSAGRTFDKPTVAYEHVGFRCAKTLP